ncbi:MAG: flagellar hook capping FlgD N-terminal domain-containing protein, partial [Phycisphaerales bacterium]
MSATSALASSTTFANTTLPNKYSELSSDEFVKIMLTELSNQDPLKPQDSSTLIQQMANILSIQSDVDLSKKLDSLVTQNQLAT